MLKRLELIGFKSFADKTTFDFPPGITAIVGPNGSGKSNVVDAVRWLLGEQSAKSLRGGEMADVIFNGSTSRRSLGMAEVVMLLDNTRRVLAFEADEVRITRRIYRDGTGEYLINGRPCRLKDVKDLFLGSGAGTQAYSIIEQGRVDALLQASTVERRLLFEEAAGISRFKAKKRETLAKLERVDQNLSRVKDVLHEVDQQLRAAQLQAAKAQRWQEYSTRLQELRIGLGLQEWRELTARLREAEAHFQALCGEVAAVLEQSNAWESEAADLEICLARNETRLAQETAELTKIRQAVAALEATLVHERQSELALQEEGLRVGRQRAQLTRQIDELTLGMTAVLAESVQVEKHVQTCRNRAESIEYDLRRADRDIVELERLLQHDRASQPDRERQAAVCRNEERNIAQHLERLKAECERRERKIVEKQAEFSANDQALTALSQSDADLQARITELRRQRIAKQDERTQLLREAELLQQKLDGERLELSSLSARMTTLEELERSQEGLGTGVREVMTLLERERAQPGSTPLGDNVLGLVADLLTVPHEIAPLIDLALGDAAQRIVVRDSRALDRMLTRLAKPFSGRVSFLPLKAAPIDAPTEADDDDTLAHLQVTSSVPGLARQLLGDVRLVADLGTARRMAATEKRLRFVTSVGELIEADGTLTVGTHHAEAGILSRKSELRELRDDAAYLDRLIRDTAIALADVRDRAARLVEPIAALDMEIAALTNEAGDLETRSKQLRQRQEWLADELDLTRSELVGLREEQAEQEELLRHAHAAAVAAEADARRLAEQIEDTEEEIRRHKLERKRHEDAFTAAQRDLAQITERSRAVQEQRNRLEADLRRHRIDLDRLQEQAAGLLARLRESTILQLDAGSKLASLYAAKQEHESRIAQLTAAREQDQKRRRELLEQLQQIRFTGRQRQDAAHEHEMRLRELTAQRSLLASRLRDDYQADLAALAQTTPIPNVPFDPAAVQTEIDDLRTKLKRLGSVNLDALRELAEIETRAKHLHEQFDDLTNSKAQLLAIIARINAESTTLFTETFAAIRTHFQELFRKLFAGGIADIVLENPADVLESGIDIKAKPPGKELRSLSLLSGGEKTMTAIALLLAIFRSRPSPFCLLDEVDAALDEGNTERLASVLKEFLDRSQFILITHKKRSMAVADVLYGITMQESGISKQIAVRFEDWEEPAQRQAA